MDYKILAQKLVDSYQENFPLESRPFESIARCLGVTEEEVMNCLEKMQETGIVGRVGPLFNARKMGESTLAAAHCPMEKIEEISEFINQFHEVNHNYQREGELNLWFVVTAPDQKRLDEVIAYIEESCQVKVLKFPMVKAYKIDLRLSEKIDWEAI